MGKVRKIKQCLEFELLAEESLRAVRRRAGSLRHLVRDEVRSASVIIAPVDGKAVCAAQRHQLHCDARPRQDKRARARAAWAEGGVCGWLARTFGSVTRLCVASQPSVGQRP